MIRAFLGPDKQACFVAMGSIYGLGIQSHGRYNSTYIPIQILGRLENIHFSLKNTSFGDFRGMKGSDIILLVPGGNKKVI
jgi:hypothetical protein